MAKAAETTTTKLYMHKDATEGNAFILKMKAFAFSSTNEDVKTMVKHDFNPLMVDTAKRPDANRDLFYMILPKIGNDTLINTLGERYPEDGCEAIKYISNFWSTGANEDKIDSYFEEYNEKITASHSDATHEDIVKLFNDLRALRTGFTKSVYSSSQINSIRPSCSS